MIDPRFATAGVVPSVAGFGAQQIPTPYRHHRRSKHKPRNKASLASFDESIRKVNQEENHHLEQNDASSIASGYGVPLDATGHYHSQPLEGTKIKHRRHHHHRHQRVDAMPGGEPFVGLAPDQLIGQRSPSMMEQQGGLSPFPVAEGYVMTAPGHRRGRHRRRHHHHHHHHHGGGISFGGGLIGVDGYGHINENLIFIERGDHSPHRQEPPPGFEYKGKIEVQGAEARYRSRSRCGVPAPPIPITIPRPLPPPIPAGPCPPGWHSVALPATSGGFSGGFSGGYSGGFGGGGSSQPQCQLVADYVFGSGGYQQGGGSSYINSYHDEQIIERGPGRPVIIEVWQKRSKSRTRSRSRSRSRTPTGPSFDFERFRSEILSAIERIVTRESNTSIFVNGRGDGSHPIHPYPGGDTGRPIIRPDGGSGEVRVIVQPIQPVFYMPRPISGSRTPQPIPQPIPIPIIPPQPLPQPSPPQVIYVPRNVYVPVIKPVFVPRERVIVRPQVIHVARPVLVDRPVPVTQRPIIIDRERPIPVPVRTENYGGQAGGSKIVREEYVYRDNLPVAYGGRCAEFAGGINYGYMPTQLEHQYANSATHEVSNIYQSQGPTIDVTVPNQYQQNYSTTYVDVSNDCGPVGNYGYNTGLHHSRSGPNLNLQGGRSFHGSFQNFSGGNSASIAGLAFNGAAHVEVLDTTVNPFWQKTDNSTLMRRYGPPACDIVNKSKAVEQQMFSEIRHRSSSGGVARSASIASYG